MKSITQEKVEMESITPYGYVKDGKVVLKKFDSFDEREVGEVRENPEESLQYFVDRYNHIKEKIEQIEKDVESSENKGSYLMKILHMRSKLVTYNGLGDFVYLFSLLNELEDKVREYINENRVRNEVTKTNIVQEAELLKDSTQWKEASEKYSEMKSIWIRTGNASDEVEEVLRHRFEEAVNHFFNRRNSFFKKQTKVAKDRIDEYKQLIDEVKEINNAGRGIEKYYDIRDIKGSWKKIGAIPKKKLVRLNQEFETELSAFFKTIKQRIDELHDIDEALAQDLKGEYLKDVQRILNSGSPYRINKVKEIQGTWRKLGRFPTEEDKTVNLKFRIVCNEIFESYFLDMAAKNSSPNFFKKSKQEQLNVKLDLVAEDINKDEMELSVFDNQMSDDGYDSQELIKKKSNLINKIRTKKRIEKKLRDELDTVNPNNGFQM